MKAIRYFAMALLLTMIALTTSYALSKGDKAPDFQLKTTDGKTLSLSAVRKGTTKVVLLDFWSTSCPPCVDEIPHLQKLYQKYNKRGMALVGVAGYRGDTAEDVKSFMKEMKMTYPSVMDSAKSVARQYGLRYLPTMVVIDKNGVIKNIHIGYTEPQVLESEIKALLK